MEKNILIRKSLATFFLSLLIVACDEQLDQEPVDTITGSIIVDLEDAEFAIAGLYNVFDGFYSVSLLAFEGNVSDEQTSVVPDPFSTNNLDASLAISSWSSAYTAIRTANNIIELVPLAEELSEEQKNQFISEAKCVRAWNHFLLAQFYGPVPYVTTTNFNVAKTLERIGVNEIYTRILADLEEAKQFLPFEYESVEVSRTRFTKGSVSAFLAKIYLFSGNWEAAESEATEVIENNLYRLVQNYDNVFVPNSEESILELYSSGQDRIHIGPASFLIPASRSFRTAPSNKIIAAFVDEDLRTSVSLNTDLDGITHINKYRDINFSGAFQEIKVMRLAEQYLIRAEARAQQGNITGSLNDLNIVRNRAGLPDVAASTQSEILLAIENERFLELAFEGHRWIDLKRTNRVDEVMSSFNPDNWQSTDRLFPIPQDEINLNPSLTQNPGY